MVGSICVLIRKAPYGTEDAFAGLRLGLATIANGIETKIILIEDGVFNAKKQQNPKKIGMPSILEALNDLLSLDVKIYCLENDLRERKLKKEDLINELDFFGENELSDLILECDVMTSF